MKHSLMARTGAMLAAASFVLLGSLSAGAANASTVSHSAVSAVAASASTPAGEIGIQSVWLPYDYSAIKSAGACEARRNYLIMVVDWISTSNSRCQRFTQISCGSTSYYWYVMVLQPDGGRIAGREALPAEPVAALC